MNRRKGNPFISGKAAVNKAISADAEYKISTILEWAEHNPQFDTEFVEQLQNLIDQGEHLTEGQEQALENILDGFGIDW